MCLDRRHAGIHGYKLNRAPSVRSIVNGVIHGTPTALQASGIFIRFRETTGSGISCVTTVNPCERACATRK